MNCTACIDACDEIMEKVDLPKGLIRYASEDNITKKAKFQFSPRLKAYTGVLTILVGLLVGLLFIRSNIEADIMRLPGQLYETTLKEISAMFIPTNLSIRQLWRWIVSILNYCPTREILKL